MTVICKSSCCDRCQGQIQNAADCTWAPTCRWFIASLGGLPESSNIKRRAVYRPSGHSSTSSMTASTMARTASYLGSGNKLPLHSQVVIYASSQGCIMWRHHIIHHRRPSGAGTKGKCVQAMELQSSKYQHDQQSGAKGQMLNCRIDCVSACSDKLG